MKSYNVWSAVTSFFNMACFQSSFILYYLSLLWFLLQMNNNLLYECTTLFTHVKWIFGLTSWLWNKAAKNIYVWVFVPTCFCFSWAYRWERNCCVKELLNLISVGIANLFFQCSCTILHSFYDWVLSFFTIF